MSENEVGSLCEALRSVPVQWRADFVRFVEEGEGTNEFFVFLEQNAESRRACEMALRADHEILLLLEPAAELAIGEEVDSVHL